MLRIDRNPSALRRIMRQSQSTLKADTPPSSTSYGYSWFTLFTKTHRHTVKLLQWNQKLHSTLSATLISMCGTRQGSEEWWCHKVWRSMCNVIGNLIVLIEIIDWLQRRQIQCFCQIWRKSLQVLLMLCVYSSKTMFSEFTMTLISFSCVMLQTWYHSQTNALTEECVI